jgi:uncharacterized ion transporter superfamily protein YfcC
MISLVLQAAGGGVSSISVGQNAAGVDCTLAGLGFQVFTLTLFVALSLDYAIRYAEFRKMMEHSTKKAAEHNEPCERAGTDPLTKRFKIFVSFLALAIICIIIRCCYRIAELKEGYEGDLFHDEGTFIGLESV